MSLRGNCRTLSERIDWSPAIRMTTLTTSASTGRRTQRSVIFISAVLRPRNGMVRRLRRVVDEHRRAVPELEHPRRHDFLAGLDAREHRDLVAASGAQRHELLAH